MQSTLLWIHVVVGILFSLSVLMQDKGVGFGTAVGGAGGAGVYTSQRGAAKVLQYISTLLAIVFLGTALVYVVLPADPDAPVVTPTIETTGDTSPTIDVTPVTE